MTSQQPTPTALNFTPDNLRAFAYSGPVAVTNDENTLIEFTTNSEYLVAKVGIGSLEAQGDDYGWRIYMNDIIINGRYLDRTYNEGYDMDVITEFIIPPFTNFKMTLDNHTGASGRTWMAMLSARAYGMTETGYQ